MSPNWSPGTILGVHPSPAISSIFFSIRLLEGVVLASCRHPFLSRLPLLWCASYPGTSSLKTAQALQSLKLSYTVMVPPGGKVDVPQPGQAGEAFAKPWPHPPRPSLPSGPSRTSHCEPQIKQRLRGRMAQRQRTGVLCARLVTRRREGPSSAKGGVAQAPPHPPAPPIGRESSDSRAEQEGNRSRKKAAA